MAEEFKDLDEKKKYLLSKYTQPKFKLEDHKKFCLYKKPIGSKDFFAAEFICSCSTREDIIAELSWRLEFIKTGDKSLLFKHDPRFKTFQDDSQTGKTLEDYMELEFDGQGEFFIMEVYS
jgi:hypothetical protein